MKNTFSSLILAASLLASAGAAPTLDSPISARARTVLRQIMGSEQSWVKIHAAEALIASGEAESVRAVFLKERPATESSAYRIGVWRVLAETAPSAEERADCVAKVERVFLDPTAIDRPQSLETLNKLRCPLTGPSLATARQMASGMNIPLRMLGLWALELAGEPGGLQRIGAALAEDDVTERQLASYALRWLHPADPDIRRQLARAADAEPSDSKAYAFLLSAAMTLDPNSKEAALWQAKLERVQDSGPVDACWEASQGLAGRLTAADSGRLAKLLESPENDKRVGAALDLLSLK